MGQPTSMFTQLQEVDDKAHNNPEGLLAKKRQPDISSSKLESRVNEEEKSSGFNTPYQRKRLNANSGYKTKKC